MKTVWNEENMAGACPKFAYVDPPVVSYTYTIGKSTISVIKSALISEKWYGLGREVQTFTISYENGWSLEPLVKDK